MAAIKIDRSLVKSLIMPYFVVEGRNKVEPIKALPGISRLSADNLIKDIKDARKFGINKVLLFGKPKKKDDLGSNAYFEAGAIQNAIRLIKKQIADITVISDVCLCAYTTHGHCGVLDNKKFIDQPKTLAALAKIALSHAEAGADYLAPSAMAKYQVAAIRKALDKSGFKKTKIMGYSAKFYSNFYGPFREALDSAPKFGDRSGYQLDFKDSETALNRIKQDIKEGADIVMVKPALSYLDIIAKAKARFNFKLAAYNVSGEYAMVKAYAKDAQTQKNLVLEIITGIKRAGADFIITYHAKDIAKWLK